MHGLSITRGEDGVSSIGEGLAATIFSFPNLEEARTRVIVLVSDDVARGEISPIVTMR